MAFQESTVTGGHLLRAGSLAAAILIGGALSTVQVADAAKIEYPIFNQYHMPKPMPVKAKQEEIDQLDADTAALIDQLKTNSPSAVEFAERAHGILIFPKVESANYLLISETNALGVLYVKDATSGYERAGYYFGERNALGFKVGTQISSRVFMFMKQKTLDEFLQGDVTATFMRVDPISGAVEGGPDADVAVFITNVEGDVEGASFEGLKILPVEFIE